MPLSLQSRESLEQWTFALGDALNRSMASAEGLELFHEERVDLTVEVASPLAPKVNFSRSHGLAARNARASVGLLYHTDPDPDDVARLVRLAVEGKVQRANTGTAGAACGAVLGRPNEAEALSALDYLLQQAESRASGARFRARWIGFDQIVQVARVGRETANDHRRGRRVRLEAALDAGGRGSRAVVDQVLSPDLMRSRTQMDRAVLELATRLEARLFTGSLPSGEYPVVFAPGIGGVLVHELIGHALEADAMLDGRSWIARAGPNSRIAVKELTVLDDPRRGRAAWHIDDEGVPARPVALVRAGHVASWLLDRQSSQRSQRAMTGHGRCSSFREAVRPRMGCTFIGAGAANPGEMLDGIESGIYVHRMEAANVDPMQGSAVFRVTDSDRIRNGSIAGSLVPHLLVLDGSTALNRIEKIADDLAFDRCVGSCLREGQPLPISVGAPTIRIDLVSALF